MNFGESPSSTAIRYDREWYLVCSSYCQPRTRAFHYVSSSFERRHCHVNFVSVSFKQLLYVVDARQFAFLYVLATKEPIEDIFRWTEKPSFWKSVRHRDAPGDRKKSFESLKPVSPVLLYHLVFCELRSVCSSIRVWNSFSSEHLFSLRPYTDTLLIGAFSAIHTHTDGRTDRFHLAKTVQRVNTGYV